MRRRSKLKGFEIPPFALYDFRVWLKETDFDILYDSWVQSNYNKFKKPSVDRIDDCKGYTFVALNINRRSINNVLSGTSKTAGGYKWEYLQ